MSRDADDSLDFDFDYSLNYIWDLFAGDIPILEDIKDQLLKIQTQTEEWKVKMKSQSDSFIKEKRLQLNKKLYAQKTLRLRDKVSFVAGVSFIWITAIVMGKYPSWMHVYHLTTIIPLISLRWFIYKSKKWHYFLADLCYFVNILLILLCFVFTKSRFLYSATFCLANGPVAWAIYAWRNSLVFHSLDKMTSIAIHISPPLTMYAMRWFQDGEPMELWTLEPILCGTIVYIIWQLLYAYFIMIQRAEKVHNGHATSFTWLLQDYTKNKKDSYLVKMFLSVPPWAQPLLFMAVNFVFALATSIPTILYYRSFWIHTVFIIALVMVSTFNGADYYIEVFSRRYTIELSRLEQAAKEMVHDQTVKDMTHDQINATEKPKVE